MALYLFAANSSTPVLEVLNTSNPQKPALMCTLIPAQGGRFQSSTQLLFWVGNALGTADLASGKTVQTGRLPAVPSEGVYSSDGRQFAYRVGTDQGGLSTHLYQFGADPADRTLYEEEPIGGHGGVPFGPYDQLQFSADGKELLDYWMFRPTSGPANLLVFRADGSRLFQETGTVSGVWSTTGSVLYFPIWNQQGLTGEIDSLDESGHQARVATGLHGYYWPTMAPDGRSIVYDTYDTSAPGQATGGLPHLWQLNLASHSASKLAGAVSSRPVFAGAGVVWSNEEKPCDCGPGGASAADGLIVAHDLSAGTDALVDMSATVPGIGAQPVMPTTASVLDTRFG
jgi:hypothetical protein